MPLWNSKDATRATHGQSSHDWEASGVSIDSRKISKGDLFIAIVGENMDGHAFVAAALQQGAAAAMVHYIPEGLPADAPLLVVEDTMEGLWDLARFSRARLHGKVIMVTGSVGKTSTKEMLAHALDHQGKTYATIGNLNNHYGLPLTLARTPADTDYTILEVGMNHANEISPLSVLAEPHVAIITTVEPVHLEFFESVEGIADAKAEIFDGMGRTGTAILNQDNSHIARLQAKAEDQGIGTILRFGKGEGADFQLRGYKQLAEGAEIFARCGGQQLHYNLGIAGEHQALNSLAVLAAVGAAGADIKKAAASFAQFEPKSGRGKRHHLTTSFGNITLIDETYNASPASVNASLRVLGAIKADTGRRTVAVLGDMFELGDNAQEMHLQLLQTIAQTKTDMVCMAGQMMQHVFDALPNAQKGVADATSEALAPHVFARLQDGDVVLVKGSRGMKMEKVVNYIIEEGQKQNAI